MRAIHHQVFLLWGQFVLTAIHFEGNSFVMMAIRYEGYSLLGLFLIMFTV